MFRPAIALLVLLGSPNAIAHAQSGREIDPATLAVLHDPARRQLRISVVEEDLQATEQRLTTLDRTPFDVMVGVGIALAAAGWVAEVVALFALGLWELAGGFGCGVSTLIMEPCHDPPTPPWIGLTAIAGAPAIGVGLITLVVGVSQLDATAREDTRLVRRRDGRLRELELLRTFSLRATGDSVVVGATGTF